MQTALVTVWEAANRICSKRLVPFLPQFVTALERHGHLSLSERTRERLLSVSPATVDRLLYEERQKSRRGRSTTKAGSLLKHQVPIRTFADWDEDRPGFSEADLVAHCGTHTSGSYLNSLVVTDIATTWTEFVRDIASLTLKMAFNMPSTLVFPVDIKDPKIFAVAYWTLDTCLRIYSKKPCSLNPTPCQLSAFTRRHQLPL